MILSALVVALTGFVALSYEIVWFRACSWAGGGAPAIFGVMLGFYLLGLAVGAMFTQRLCDGPAAQSPSTLRRLGVYVFLANGLGFLVVPGMAHLATAASWVPGLALVAGSAGLLGAVLPLVSHFGVPADHLAGARLSYLYLANILGSAAGSLLTGFVLMEHLGLAQICMALGAAGLLVSGGLLAVGGLPRGQLAGAAALLVATGIGGAAATPSLFDGVYERLMLGPDYSEGFAFARVIENRSGVIAITEDDRVFGGGVYDGVISVDLVDDRNLLIRPFALQAFHPAPREVLMIGMATGAWAQAVVSQPGVEKLTIIEINPGYLEVIPRHPAVASLMENPKVEVIIDDGRRWLQRNPDRTFDAIVSNTTFYWRAHASALLSVEFLEMLQARLKPGGIAMYNTTFSALALKTGFTVFPHGYQMINCVVGSDAPIDFDADRWRAALLATRIDGRPLFDLSDPAHAARLEEVLSIADTLDDPDAGDMRLISRDEALAGLEGVGVITDDNMASEWVDLRF